MSDEIKPADILTPKELSKRLKVKIGWVYEATRKRGRVTGTPLPFLKVGRYLRFVWPDVCLWLRSNQS